MRNRDAAVGERASRRLQWRDWLCALCASALTAAIVASGLLYLWDNTVEDSFYQQPEALDGSIAVIGITAEDLDTIGAWPWDRSVLARVLETLNADPENAPAAIGVDVLFAEASDPASDAALIQAASAGNVATACSAVFSSAMEQQEDGRAYMNDFHVTGLVSPFPALAQVTRVGHINAMYDADGILRHHLWAIPGGSGGEIPSLPNQVYQLYCDYWGRAADYTPPCSDRGFWYFNFTGEPGAYFEYSVSDILDGSYDPARLSGAAVLIGPYDTGMQDDYVTAADRAQRMYGVEYLANALDAMLRQSGKQEVSAGVQYALTAAVCFAAMAALLWLNLWQGGLFCGVSVAGLLVACRLAYDRGWILHPLWLLLGVALCYLFSIFHHYWTSQQEKRFLRATFQRYVDPKILQAILKEDSSRLHLQGKVSQIAVLFVDLRGFTSLSEHLTPEEVVSILNEYLTLTSDCIRSNGGTLDKFVGDCTMAFWGAPLPCQDPVYQACQAAVSMLEQAETLTASIQRQFGRTIGFGVGVHYGPAVVGNIGAAYRMDYTAIGDTVNIASRLESSAPPRTIYISRTVAEQLGARGQTTSLGKISLKGKAESFEVLTLDSLAPATGDEEGIL